MTRKKQLTKSLERRLASYAVGMLGVAAVAPAAAAQVIYTQTNLTFVSGSITFDIDANGTPDFYLMNNELSSFYFAVGALEMRGNPSERNAVVGHYRSGGTNSALPVPKGVAIGPGSPAIFLKANSIITPLMAAAGRNYSEGYKITILKGQFANTTAKYLGFRFTGSGGPHYGWMRLSVVADPSVFPSLTVKVSGYAYEATPNTAIIAGDRGLGSTAANAGSLGALALGAAKTYAGHN